MKVYILVRSLSLSRLLKRLSLVGSLFFFLSLFPVGVFCVVFRSTVIRSMSPLFFSLSLSLCIDSRLSHVYYFFLSFY